MENKFLKSLKKIRNRTAESQIKAFIDGELVFDPYHLSVQLKDEKYAGKRRSRIGDYRLTFLICEECRENFLKDVHQCKNCADTPNRFLKLLHAGHRGKIYR